MFKNKIKKGDLRVLSVVDYESFKFYRENSTFSKEEFASDYKKHSKILTNFYSKVGEKVVECEGGVFIEKLGYFSGIVDTIKQYSIYPQKTTINLNIRTSGYKFFLIFIPISKDNTLKEWVGDSCFTRKIKSEFSKKLKEGKKFRFNPTYFIKKYGIKHKE